MYFLFQKILPSYMVGNFMGDDSIESLKKKRAEEAAEKEKHRQFSRMVCLKPFIFRELKLQEV